MHLVYKAKQYNIYAMYVRIRDLNKYQQYCTMQK